MKYPDILIVGAGISGAVLARQYAEILGKKVLVIEKRDHVGGNCYDFINEEGLLMPKYGPHYFHTSLEDVWAYVNRFSDWVPYEHRNLSFVDEKLVPTPINITTVNTLFGLNLKDEAEMKEWLAKNTEHIPHPRNSEESGLARFGKVLYEKMFKSYIRKHWDVWPVDLDALVVDRIPMRTNFDDRAFSDAHQAMPKDGYTKMFERIFSHPNIEVRLNCDWEAEKESLPKVEKLFFTGKIDQYFAYKFGERLQYRSVRFDFETHDVEYYQPATTVYYPDPAVPHMRISEPKHSTGQKHPKTTIIKEYGTWDGEPYYPVPSKRNLELFARYQKEAEKLEKQGVYFVGRLANYKYFDMDKAFKNALDFFERVK